MKSWLLGTLLFFSVSSYSDVNADSGVVDVSPNPCVIGFGESTCSVSVDWSSSGDSVCVWRVYPGGSVPPVKWRCASSGTGETFPFVDEDGRVLELRSNSSGGYIGSQFLDSVLVESVEPSGSIAASPNPCQISLGESSCPVEVDWDSQHAQSVCVWRIHPSGTPSPAKWRCGSVGVGESFPSLDEDGRTLELRANSSGTYADSDLITSVSVTAVPPPDPSGSLSASPNPCTIPVGDTSCSVNVDWSSQDADSVCVWRIHPSGSPSPTKWKCGGSGADESFPYVDEDGRTLELRANSSGSYLDSVLIASEAVAALEEPSSNPVGTVSATPATCSISAGESTCTVSIDWATQGASSVCVWQVYLVGSPVKWECQSSGSGFLAHDIDQDGRLFELRSESAGTYAASTLLDQVEVVGKMQPDPSMCHMSSGK